MKINNHVRDDIGKKMFVQPFKNVFMKMMKAQKGEGMHKIK